MVGYMIINSYHQIPELVTQPRLTDNVKCAKAIPLSESPHFPDDGYSDNVTQSPTCPASCDIDASWCATNVHPVGLELNI